MEFTLDKKLIDSIDIDEQHSARSELRALGPIAAYRHSLQRHDARLAAAPDAHTLACKAGCYWCCYFSVDVRAVEVFSILDFVARECDAEEQARIRTEIEANANRIDELGVERQRLNLKCPFLSDGRCGIYAVRPHTCRNYHATDSTGCKLAFEQPDNEDIDPEFAPLVYQSGVAHVEAFYKTMAAAGYDRRVYELNSALAAAMSDPTARSRFESRGEPFPGLEGHEVPPEFD